MSQEGDDLEALAARVEDAEHWEVVPPGEELRPARRERMDKGKYSRKVEDHGETIWRLLERNPGGLTMADLTELSELTRAQVRKAFEYIRDLFAGQNDQPIIYIPGKHKNIYKLAVEKLESHDDLRRRLHTWQVQIRRARTAIAQPSIAKFEAEAPLFRRLSRHMAVVEEDLADLLNGLG